VTDSPFPLRVAAIDVGSNAVRFIAAEFLDHGRWVGLEVQRVPVRLGHQTFVTGRLDEDAMNAAVATMASFRRSLDNLGIGEYRAVATSAVRESKNGPELVDRIRRECGIRLETITGSEEARLVWLAIRSRVDLGDRPWMAMDLGGGSLEISLISPEGIHWTESHQMGTVRMLERLQGEEDPVLLQKLMAEYAQTLRIPDQDASVEIGGLLGTGGNMEAIAALAGAGPDERGVARVSMKAFYETIDMLGELSVAERIERLQLREDRADVIYPAALIYGRVAELAGVEEIHVPYVGVKEGVLIDRVDDLLGPRVHATQLEEQAFAGAIALGRRFHFDEAHHRQVARLSLSLFDQLEPLHGMGARERRMLLVAAALHDVGVFISYRRHHKHSLYIIYNSDLPGISDVDRPMTALVARYHRRATPREDHYLFRDLDDGARTVVARLASILRLADALDREHLQRVSVVDVTFDGDAVVLEVEGHGDLLLEHWAFRKRAQMFEDIFRRSVRLAVRQPAAPRGIR
jgi:exopolyphosphatase/guanosine-5'-triphosphate,3'-diphosphate pyrophosphatase